jgi:hypothetical protein
MALVKCPECETNISDKAITCPKCGNPIKKEPETSFVLRVFCLLLGIGLLLLWFGGHTMVFFPYDTAIVGAVFALAALVTK